MQKLDVISANVNRKTYISVLLTSVNN